MKRTSTDPNILLSSINENCEPLEDSKMLSSNSVTTNAIADEEFLSCLQNLKFSTLQALEALLRRILEEEEQKEKAEEQEQQRRQQELQQQQQRKQQVKVVTTKSCFNLSESTPFSKKIQKVPLQPSSLPHRPSVSSALKTQLTFFQQTHLDEQVNLFDILRESPQAAENAGNNHQSRSLPSLHIGSNDLDAFTRSGVTGRLMKSPELYNDKSMALALAALLHSVFRFENEFSVNNNENKNSDVVLGHSLDSQASVATMSKSHETEPNTFVAESAVDAARRRHSFSVFTSSLSNLFIDGLNKLKNNKQSESLRESIARSNDIHQSVHACLVSSKTRFQQTDGHNWTEQQKILFSQIDRLMMVVQTIYNHRMNNADANKDLNGEQDLQNQRYQPQQDLNNDSASSENLVIDLDLTQVLLAIDRILTFAPPFLNQRVTLTSAQERLMSEAALLAILDRLSRGRMENQRILPKDAVMTGLNHYIGEIMDIAAASSSAADVVHPGPHVRFHDSVALNRVGKGKLAPVNSVVNSNSAVASQLLSSTSSSAKKRGVKDLKRRTYPEGYADKVLCLTELGRLQEKLTHISDNPRFTNQRYILTEDKEKEMFFNSVIRKLDRLGQHRMKDQDAVSPLERDLDKISAVIERASARTKYFDQLAA